MSITIEKFIRETRKEVDKLIRECYDGYSCEDDEDRENMLLSDEGLYQWTINNGVKDI